MKRECGYQCLGPQMTQTDAETATVKRVATDFTDWNGKTHGYDKLQKLWNCNVKPITGNEVATHRAFP